MDFEGQVLENYVTGNLNWGMPATFLEITPEDLYTANQITFYMPAQDILSIPEKYKVKGGTTVSGIIAEDMRVPGMISNVSAVIPDIRAALEPIYS